MDHQNMSLYEVLQKLRSPGGCPWDREQTRLTLSRCMAEECAEVLDAIDRDDPAAICEELGDLLMNVVFQAVVAEEKREFSWEDVQRGIVEKMIRRHAHIFGDEIAKNSDEVLVLWDKIKAQEKKKPAQSVLEHIAPTLTASDYAEKIQKKAAKYGFDWTTQEQIIAKVEEELAELKEAMASGDQEHADEELGDLFFALTNLARFRNRLTSEELLRRANAKFVNRFQYIERELKKRNVELNDAGIELMEALWQEAKKK